MTLLRSFLIITSILALCLGFAQPAAAQSAALVSIDPGYLPISQDATAIIYVKISGAVDLYGFDITLGYDPAMIAVEQVAAGGFLESGFVILNQIRPENGVAQYATTQLNPSEPKSGDGALLAVTLRGLQTGFTDLRIDSIQLSDRNGMILPADLQAGQIEITAPIPPTETATQPPNTPTSPPPTRTATPVPPTRTFTAAAAAPTVPTAALPTATRPASPRLIPSRTPGLTVPPRPTIGGTRQGAASSTPRLKISATPANRASKPAQAASTLQPPSSTAGSAADFLWWGALLLLGTLAILLTVSILRNIGRKK